MKKVGLAPYIVYVLLLVTYCESNYVTRNIGGKDKKCIPYHNCPPGHEILPCIAEFTQERCDPCPDNKTTWEPDYVQPDYISSEDSNILDELRCFRPLVQGNGQPAQCTGGDVLYSRTLNTASSCLGMQGCKCNNNKCYYGDPCLCINYRHISVECAIGYHLNASGVCVPCPPGFEKNHVGCGPCLRKNNYTIPSTTQPTPASSAVNTVPQTPKPTPSPTTETSSSDVVVSIGTVVIDTGKTEEPNDPTVFIVLGVALGLIFLAVIVIVFLYRRGKFQRLKTICYGAHNAGPDEEHHDDGEDIPLNPPPEVLDNNLNDLQQNQIRGNDGKENIIYRNHSYCPSQNSDRVVFNSGSSISVNRQLSELSNEGRTTSNLSGSRLNSNSSDCSPCSPLLQAEQNHHEINRAVSVNERELHRIHNETNHPTLRHSESVPQQVPHGDHCETCVSCGSPTTPGSANRQPAAPFQFQPYHENGGGACIPLPDFDNIQTSKPVMNTELPNITEFKRSLSKDSESSVDLSSSSPFNSIPEETGKDLQEEVAAESVMVEPPHISDDYNNCHLSHVTDVPQPSDITNQIDSRLEQYNHTYTGLDDDQSCSVQKQCCDNSATCSVQRLPSEHEEETVKKNDLESNLDSGMASKMDSGMASSKVEGDSDLSTRSES